MHSLRFHDTALITLAVTVIVVPTGCVAEDGTANSLRASIVKAQFGPADNSDEVAETYKKLYGHVGARGVRELTNDEDTSIALQAAWETHKTVVARNPPVAGKSPWVFDKKSVDSFLAIFAERTVVDEARLVLWVKSRQYETMNFF